MTDLGFQPDERLLLDLSTHAASAIACVMAS